MKNLISEYQKEKERIAFDLKLKGGDKHSQDWEYEVADPNRLDEFLKFYLNNKLSPTEKRILIKLILESYNDYVGEKGFNIDYTKELTIILEKEKTLCKDIIKVWSCEGEELEDAYYITPIIRKIANEF